MITLLFDDYAAFEARADKRLNGVCPAFARRNPNYEAANRTNTTCFNCAGSSDCLRCTDRQGVEFV